MRKRVLLVNEANYLSTGFSVYGYELLKKLHSLDKYELGEFAAYAEEGDARNNTVPWKFYANIPHASNQEQVAIYNQKQTHHFGEWRFERTCLEFKPDIIIDIRDHWMYEFEERSPFRPYFKWILMPTVDSAPQEEQWLATYSKADAVLAYSEFGYNTMQEEGGNLIKLKGIASPGANLEDFEFVLDNKQYKAKLGLPQDSFIVGTVMRNQDRKLYPDLMESFANFLKGSTPEIARKSYLYLHVGYPDIGWKIPLYLKQFGLGSKTIFTYICNSCGYTFASLYQDARTFCQKCNNYSASLPGVQRGVDRKVLGKILNSFDVYVQYSVCEGFGMPQVEAAAAGVVCLAVDYSAMHDIIQNVGGYPITVQRMFYDSKTTSRRALPDNNDLTNRLSWLAATPKESLYDLRRKARQAVEERYTWDNATKVWEKVIDEIETLPLNQSWSAPSRITQPNLNIPQGLTNDQFINWAILNIAGRPELINSYVSLRLVRDLNWGASQTKFGGLFFNEASYPALQPRWEPFDRNSVIEELKRCCEHKNTWEQQRLESFTNGRI